MNYYTLPTGYTVRAPRQDDLPAVVELVAATDEAVLGSADVELDDLLQDWKRPGFDPSLDAWLVESPDGKVVGYEDLQNRAEHAFLMGDGYVHPQHTGLGIGTALLRKLEARARQHLLLAPLELRVYLRNGIVGKDRAARELHENEGYQIVRYYWRMETNLAGPPPGPVWPEGVELRPFQPESQGRRVFEAVEDAFQDHWSHVPADFNWWRQRLEQDSFDPILWFIAWEGNQIAGFSLCRYRQESGWVNTLGVRRPWRRKGLGLALLNHSFGEFYRKGTMNIGLGVDAQNPTGATRLYERAGMHVAHEFLAYEKELRPGKALEMKEGSSQEATA